MSENKIHLPQSGGGIIRYSEQLKSKIVLNPWVVIALIAFVIALEIILQQINVFGL